MDVVPFYGATHPDLFAIERDAMDRPGKVIAALNRLLPDIGTVVDVGAGNGFTAAALTTAQRVVVPVEPARAMIRRRRLPWIQGTAGALPIRSGAAAGAYATWAYFFPSFHDVTPGRAEIRRIVTEGGPVVIADNLGGDEFTALSDTPIASNPDYWQTRGFELEVVDTVFEFEDIGAARRLLEFYFADRGRHGTHRVLSFRVAICRPWLRWRCHPRALKPGVSPARSLRSPCRP